MIVVGKKGAQARPSLVVVQGRIVDWVAKKTTGAVPHMGELNE